MNTAASPSEHPGAWKASDFAGKSELSFELQASHIDGLDKALAQVRGRRPESVTQAEFPLPSMADALASIRAEVLDGRGIVILQGFPVERYTARESELAFWGLGTHLGHAVSQSQHGDRLGHVVDVSRENPNERGYLSRRELSLHTDSDNIVMMLCLRSAKSGGINRFASALTIHDEILANEPALLEPLYRGFRYHWRGEEPQGEAPITRYRIPVFSECDGRLSCIYLRELIEMAASDSSEPLSPQEGEALDRFQSIGNREDVCLRISLQPGEAFLINNFTVLHSRTEFEDHEAVDCRRHLLRLWLKVPGGRPLAEALQRYYGSDGIEPRAGGTTVYEPS